MIVGLALLLAAADPPTIYQRVEQRLAADPAAAAALGRPAPQMREMDWLVGTWDVTAQVEGRSGPPETGTSVVTLVLGGTWLEIRDTYPSGTQDLGYVGYSAMEGRWVNVVFDSLMNANRSTAPAWENGRIVFEGDYLILGLPAHLRQIVERSGADDYSVTNEERIEGQWHRLDSYHYRRRPAR